MKFRQATFKGAKWLNLEAMIFVVQHNGYTIFVFFLLPLNRGAWPSRRGVIFPKVLAGGHKQLSRLKLLTCKIENMMTVSGRDEGNLSVEK